MLRFQVEGMTCGHCAQAVTKAVQAVDAMSEVEVDLAAASVTVRGEGRREDLAAAIEAAGYKVAA